MHAFDQMDLERALARSRKPLQLDRYGMCIELFRVASEARPQEFTQWLQYVASSEACMTSLESPLLCYGKQAKDTALHDVRGVIPPCALLKILDAILSSLLCDRLTTLLPRHPDVFVGARKFTQTKDISQGLQLVIEKGLDLRSRASVAQADSRSYYDSLPVLRIVKWLLERGVERSLLASVVRHQLCSSIRIRRGVESFVIASRSCGGLTGSTVALTLARVPVGSTFLELAPSNRLKGFAVGGTRLVFASWVDNIYAASPTPEEACELVSSVFKHLQIRWNLHVKETSAVVLACRGSDLSEFFPTCGFKLVSDFEVLGSHLTDNASMAVQWKHLQACAWAAFWSNVRVRSWKRLGVDRRFAVLERCVRPIVQFKLQAFSPSKYWCKQVLKLQRHMLARCLGQHRLACDTPRDFFQRLARAVHEHIGNTVADWSVEWLKSAVSWDSHCCRDSLEQQRFCTAYPNFSSLTFGASADFGAVQEHFDTTFSWAARLSQYMGAEFFDERRTVEQLGARTHTRTSTRAVVGCVTPRYHDCVAFAQSELARLGLV